MFALIMRIMPSPPPSSPTSNHREVPCVSHFQVAYISRLGSSCKICRKNVITIFFFTNDVTCVTSILCLIKNNNNNKNPFYVKCHIVALFSFLITAAGLMRQYGLHRVSGALRAPFIILYFSVV